MNPIQLGCSDLASAYRIHKSVANHIDFRVWESDPDVDGVLSMIRNFHVAITMRFHASIFMLSQNIPVLGIDYYPGEGGKVEQLFHDLGKIDYVRRIDTFESNWMINKLCKIII